MYDQKEIPDKVRKFIYERDQGKCRGCNSPDGTGIHHIQYRSLMGNHDPENLVTLCFRCHRLIHDGLLTVRKVGDGFFFGGEKKWSIRMGT